MDLTRAMRAGLSAAAIGLLALAQPAKAQDLGIELGATGPAAVVQSLDGKATNLSEYIGKTPVLLEFWATWCENCKALEPAMKAAVAKYGKQITFVGVAVSASQSRDRVRQYVEKYGITMTMVYDSLGQATGGYDVPATSYIVILDKAGTVVYTGVGKEQNIDEVVKNALAKM